MLGYALRTAATASKHMNSPPGMLRPFCEVSQSCEPARIRGKRHVGSDSKITEEDCHRKRRHGAADCDRAC